MSPIVDSLRLPLIDLSLFDAGDPWRDHVAAQLDWAAREFGFFYVIGHGIEPGIVQDMLAESPGTGDAARDYTSALTGLGHRLMASIGRALGLGDTYFVDRYTGNATTQFRKSHFGIGDHAEHGLLTLLYQDEPGVLQVRHDAGWIDVPFVPGSFVVGVGAMLERLTSGRYTSRWHRAIDRAARAGVAGARENAAPVPEVIWSAQSVSARVSLPPLAQGSRPAPAVARTYVGH